MVETLLSEDPDESLDSKSTKDNQLSMTESDHEARGKKRQIHYHEWSYSHENMRP